MTADDLAHKFDVFVIPTCELIISEPFGPFVTPIKSIFLSTWSTLFLAAGSRTLVFGRMRYCQPTLATAGLLVGYTRCCCAWQMALQL